MMLPGVVFKKFFAAVILLTVSLFLFQSSIHAQEYKTDEVVVKMKSPLSFDERLGFHRDFGAKLSQEIQNIGVDVLRFDGVDVNRVIERLKNDPRILYAEKNYKAVAFETTNDPALVQNMQWGLTKINTSGNSDSAWTITHGKREIKVAVLDTGIAQDHEDLAGKVTNSKNCTDSDTADDRFGHGTHVAGIIAANTNNNLGIAGSGYDISLVNAKGLGDDGSGYYSWLANCLVWAADQNVQVINMSLGGPSDSQMLSDSINYAWQKGVVLVAAAGNSGSNSPSYPAYYPVVLSVAATDQNDQKASFSNYGAWVKVAAPGVGIYSTLPKTQNAFKQLLYGYGSGTSMASPFVAGLAGLLYSMDNVNQNLVVKLIEENADKIAGTGSDWQYGRINAYRSLLGVTIPTSAVTLTPIPIPTSTPFPSPTVTPSLTPTAIPTVTPTPASKSSKQVGKSPWSKICSRIPSFCR